MPTATRRGTIDLQLGFHEQAASHLRQALAIFRETGDLSRQTLALNGLGEVLLAMDRPADARTEHTAAMRLAARTGDTYGQARAQAGLASSWCASGFPGRARRLWRESLRRYDGIGAPEADQIRARLAELALAR